MKIKHWLLGTTLGISPLIGQAQSTSSKDNAVKEITVKHANDSTMTAKKSPQTAEFALPKDSLVNNVDSLNIDTISADSLARIWADLSVREKINSCTDQMLIYLTTFEDVRAKAYWESAGGVPTVGPGFVYINNKRISRNYRFKNMEALVNTWNKDLQKQGSWLDNYEAYMYEIIDSMRPTNAKEMLACQSEICAPFSLVWQNHTKSLGSPASSKKLLEARRLYTETGNPIYKNKADSIFEKCATNTMKAYLNYKRTGNDEDKEAFRKEYIAWSKITLKDKRGRVIRDKNGNPIKKTLPSSVARREAEFSFIIGENIMTMGPLPQELANDSTVKYVDVLELAVGAVATLKDPKTGKLPPDWVDKAQNLKADSTTTRYQKEFPELRQGSPSATSVPQKEHKDETQNPLILFFQNLRNRTK